MGRNDNRIMVSVSKHGEMISKLLLLGLLLMLSSQISFADEKKKNVRMYKFRVDRPVKSEIIYQFTDETDITRIFSDSTSFEYKRKIDYFFSQKVFGDPNKGLLNVTYTIDSIRYFFNDGPQTIRLNTASDFNNASDFEDFTVVTPSLGRSFDLIYSDYGDVAKVESEDFDWLRDYINDPKNSKAIQGMRKYLWLNGIGDSRLRHIVDIPKIMMMKEKKALDSTWESPMYFETNHLEFFAKPKVRVAEYRNGKFVMDAVFDTLVANKKDYYFYNTKNLCSLQDAKGKGSSIIYFDKRGLLDRMEMDVVAEIKAKQGKEVFTEKIQSNLTWQAIKKVGM